MDVATREFARRRAGNRCEYCRLPQHAVPLIAFHVDHVHAMQHVNDDSLDNLALACPECNFHKGPNVASIDQASGQIVPLFHPRRDNWEDHFELRGAFIVGVTDNGAATVRVLQMNRPEAIELRQELQMSGEL